MDSSYILMYSRTWQGTMKKLLNARESAKHLKEAPP
jgi:hypothetical protein